MRGTDKIFKHEKELYPIIESFLNKNKNCKYYVGNELSMGAD